MHTSNTNKLALAVLGTLLGSMALGVSTNALYAPVKPAKAGYDLPAEGVKAEANAGGAEAVSSEPLPVLLAKADAAKGQANAKACLTCHSFDKAGAPGKAGPMLYGVVGRPKATVTGYSYSDVFKGLGGDWKYEDINRLLTSPKAFAAGTKMTYPGEADAKKRADILAYLQTLSDSPVPFPK